MKQSPMEPAASRQQAMHTQKQAAELLDVHYRTWQNWEAGVTEMPGYALKLYRHLAGLERIHFPRRDVRRGVAT